MTDSAPTQSAPPTPPGPRPAWQRNLPNALTIARVMMTAAFVAVLSTTDVSVMSRRHLGSALALFVVAALTDALDGYLARRWNVISVFGRIMDPLADKILVLGAFVMLAGPTFHAQHLIALHQGPWQGQVSGVYPWMVVIILARELLITSLRAIMESRGVDFSANWTGKSKMIAQSVGVPAILLVLYLHTNNDGEVSAMLKRAFDDQSVFDRLSAMRTPTLLEPWLTIVDVIAHTVTFITALSAIPYITRAVAALRKPA